MAPLTPKQIDAALHDVKHWAKEAVAIRRTYEFKDFAAAMVFVNKVAALAEEAWHHPDIDIRWNKVTLTLTSHGAGGLTKQDFALAKKIDMLGA